MKGVVKLEDIYEKLLDKAEKARENAYAPYSEFYVGSALITKNGKVYTGCNVENSAYSLCICAERNAIARAVGDGEREISVIAVIGGEKGKETRLCPPCGACRQVMAEFAAKEFCLILRDELGNVKRLSLDEILPLAFSI